MPFRKVIPALLLLIFSTVSHSAPPPTEVKESDFLSVDIFKSKSCGCCTKYANILGKKGISCRVRNVDDVRGIYVDLGIESAFQSCHMTVSQGYFFSGHVPAEDIKTVLNTQPNIRGLLVPGMPINSPGMEVTGHKGEAFDVYSLDFKGNIKVFKSYEAISNGSDK